ncbi:hypothetical protein TNCV_2094421 [Trichonephila clavipes]|nr:hypothetical protein TNCV_2094421 [Trichonephila clavipes]
MQIFHLSGENKRSEQVVVSVDCHVRRCTGAFFYCSANHLHATYPGRCIGRSGTVVCSPHFYPLDFFLLNHLKSLVLKIYISDTVEYLTARIVVAYADIANTLDLFKRVRQSFVCSCRLCCHLRGRNFEQFL